VLSFLRLTFSALRPRTIGLSARSDPQFWVAVWVALLSFAWLIPNRYLPLTEFFADFWISACLLGGCLFLLFRHTNAWKEWPLIAVVLLVLALVPWIQWWLGLIPTHGQASLSSMYLLGAAMVTLAGFVAHRLKAWDALSLLFAAILLASILNTGVLITQYLGLYPYDDIGFPGLLILRIAAEQRPTGNVAQANIAGTLCLWGALSAWWFFARGKIRWPIMAGVGFYLMLAAVLTQSRIAFLSLIGLAVVSALLSWKMVRHRGISSGAGQQTDLAVVLQPVIWLMLYVLIRSAIGALHTYWDWGQGVREAVFQDSLRPVVYEYFSKAILLKPWFGFGMTHLTGVQMEVIPDGIAMNSYFFHSHNVLIDIFLWFGLPMGIALITYLSVVAWRVLRGSQSVESGIALGFLFVFTMHAMVELPHMWGIMLFPSCWILGALYANTNESHGDSRMHLRVVKLPRQVPALSIAVITIGLAALWMDYSMIQREFWTLRMDHARVGPRGLDRVESTLLLNHLENRIRLGRLSKEDLDDPAKLEWIKNAARGFPSPSTHFLYVKALALHRSNEEVLVEMQRLNRLTTKAVLQKFELDWETFRTQYPNRTFPDWIRSGALLSPDLPTTPKIDGETPLHLLTE
jgi:hypothetical protein